MKMFISGLIATTLVAPACGDSHAVFGTWLTEAGDGHVEISDCGDGTPCGVLVWVDPDLTPSAYDTRNPDEALRSRPLIGTPIVWGYERSKKNWRGGAVYNPEDGKTFRSTIERADDASIRVTGCLGPICRSNIWTKVAP
ncbi:MAG: DUF2147 domain-containing protein [Pseudomonadota bacterium]